MDDSSSTTLGRIGAVWGIVGVVLILSTAVARLAPMAVESFAEDLGWIHWVGYAGSLFFLGYTEGYKAFQKQFSPRVVARAQYLAKNPTPLRVILAPPFCMGFFHATKKRLIVSWSLAAGIVGLVVLVKLTPQPWRGIIDFGVVVALSWGIVAILAFAARALGGGSMPVPDDVPELSGSSVVEAA